MKIPNGIFVFIEPAGERQVAKARTKLECMGTREFESRGDQKFAIEHSTRSLLSQMADVIAEAKRLGWEF